MGEVPPVVQDLVGTVADARAEDFAVGPIFGWDAPRRPRVAVADSASPDWEATVRRSWPGAGPLLDAAPAGCRRMVDTDGHNAIVYLDDLQEHGLTWQGRPLMCLTWSSRSGQRETYTRHERLPAGAPVDVGPLADAGGVWGVRWQKRRPVGLLWVSEARWRESWDEANAALSCLGRCPAWERASVWLDGQGWQAYPDAVELLVGGRIDVTLGLRRR